MGWNLDHVDIVSRLTGEDPEEVEEDMGYMDQDYVSSSY